MCKIFARLLISTNLKPSLNLSLLDRELTRHNQNLREEPQLINLLITNFSNSQTSVRSEQVACQVLTRRQTSYCKEKKEYIFLSNEMSLQAVNSLKLRLVLNLAYF